MLPIPTVLNNYYLNHTSQLTGLFIETAVSHASIVADKVASIGINPWFLPAVLPLSECAMAFKESIENRSFSEVIVSSFLTGLFGAFAYGVCSDYAVISWSSELFLIAYTTASISERFGGAPAPALPAPVAKAARPKIICEEMAR